MDTNTHNPTTTTQALDVQALQQQFTQQGLGQVLQPQDHVVVTGLLTPQIIPTLKNAGIETVVSVQPDDEMTFDEQAALNAVGIDYRQVPIRGAENLTQATINAFDRVINEQQGKRLLMHCKSGNRVGAAVALRAGWLQKLDTETAINQGKAAGLLGLEPDVRQRLAAAN